MKRLFHLFAKEETGQTLIEYALILAFILFAVIGVAAGYNQSIGGVTTMTNQNLSSAAAFVR